MENLADNIFEKTGLAGTPLKKMPPKDKKRLKDSLTALQQIPHNIPQELLLRACLLSGGKPCTETKTAEIIANALTLKDALHNASKLIDSTIVIDGENLFTAIKLITKLPDKTMLKQTSIKSIIGFTLKWWEKALSKKNRLTDKTEYSIIALVNELSQRMEPPRNLDDNVIIKFGLFLYPMFKVLFGVATKSSFPQTSLLSYRTIVKITRKFPSLIVNSILADGNLSNDIEAFKQTMLKSVESIVLNGDLEQLREFNGVIDETFNMRVLFIERMREIWDSYGATFNQETQRFIRNVIFDEQATYKPFELVKEDEHSNISQLAGALISSWVARNDGPLALDSFRLLSSVAEKFYNLKIGGDIDTIVNFNKFAHEATGKAVLYENTTVQIVRPWVEWIGKERRIIIKALVKPL